MKLAALSKKDIGRTVAYKHDDCKPEVGIITSYNNMYVFVRYGNSLYSQATYPDNLEFEIT